MGCCSMIVPDGVMGVKDRRASYPLTDLTAEWEVDIMCIRGLEQAAIVLRACMSRTLMYRMSSRYTLRGSIPVDNGRRSCVSTARQEHGACARLCAQGV